ncbi:hypothetical protein [Mucilaginibacter segetis]|uniref:Uncharacterized protein n=1 Tax=Mucilaginibacter segetis TaxID=2793071 RepID=A0A934UPE8_9SPHI|nr:hypothetical protein [Mucilaginibacter segetis]MBK0380902.1 hypothetical protein [Mucilaginibacter segetis]
MNAFAQSSAQKHKEDALSNSYFSSTELKPEFLKYNFSEIFTHTKNSDVYGFIGDNYQRIRVKFISVEKNPVHADTYSIYGKSMVKNNIDEFYGVIKITNIRAVKNISYGVDNEYKSKGIKGEYTIIGDYLLKENSQQTHSGVLKGCFISYFYIDNKNALRYDDINFNADGYSNNEFVGEWISYNGKLIKKCNWGDFRIPDSGDLDIGAAEFSPATKYLTNGWQTLRDIENPASKRIENIKWWE